MKTQNMIARDSSFLRRPACRALILFGVTLLGGCDSVSTRFVTGLSAEERALAAQLPVFSDRLPEGSYEMVGPVSGLSCQVNPSDGFRASEDGTLDELMRAAVSAGGNAVMNIRCEALSRGEGGRNCFRSFECRGDAVKTLSADTS